MFFITLDFHFFSLVGQYSNENEPLNLGDSDPECVHFYYRENNNKKGRRDLHQGCQGYQLQSVVLQNPSIFAITSFYLELKESCSPQVKVFRIGFSTVELTSKRGVCHFVTATCNKYLTMCRVSGYWLEIMNSNWVCQGRETGCDASMWFSYDFLSKGFWAAQGTIWEEDVRYHELNLGFWWTEGWFSICHCGSSVIFFQWDLWAAQWTCWEEYLGH